MKGRKKLPSGLKLLKGTFEKSRENPDEPKPETAIPAMPGHLSPDAIKEWERITVELAALGLITKIDRAALAAYCTAYARWVEAECMLAFDGRLMVLTGVGSAMANPLIKIANDAMVLMHRFLTEFGLSPASRGRVASTKQGVGKSEKPKNPFAVISGLKNG